MRPLLRRRTPPEVTWSPIPGRGLRGLSGRAGAMGDDAQAADGVAWRVDFGSPAAPNARISLWTYTVERYRGGCGPRQPVHLLIHGR
jgi:hypothetical protein